METDRISLRPLEKEDIYKVKEWRNKDSIRKNMFSSNIINNFQQDKWFENYSLNSSQIIFSIIYKENKELIGTISLSNIDRYHQRAELGTLIGIETYWGKGLATEALDILVDYAFNELNLNKIYSYIFEDNTGSIKKNKKNGFKIDGALRKHAFSNGNFKNVVVMSLLKSDHKNK